jgi:hypothetical protein
MGVQHRSYTGHAHGCTTLLVYSARHAQECTTTFTNCLGIAARRQCVMRTWLRHRRRGLRGVEDRSLARRTALDILALSWRANGRLRVGSRCRRCWLITRLMAHLTFKGRFRRREMHSEIQYPCAICPEIDPTDKAIVHVLDEGQGNGQFTTMCGT